MAFGALLGKNPGYTKEQTYSTATQALYPSGTDLPDQALELLSKAIVESQDGTELKNLMGEVIASLPLSGVQIETGSYVGTGTYGSDNKNTLNFGFKPKLVFITSEIDGDTAILQTIAGIRLAETSIYGSQNYKIYVSLENTTIFWYAIQDAETQQNTSGVTYEYCAIG